MLAETPALGCRIVVWGTTGSGKTTLARQLGAALGLPVVELDGIRHRHGWDGTDWPEFREELTQTLESYRDGWVLEGSYHPIMDVYLSRADTMVWLHLPFRVSFTRLLRRTVARAWDRAPLYNPDGPTESWRQSFFSQQSILWYAITSHRGATRRRGERVAALPPHIRVYELRSSKDVSALKDNVSKGGSEQGDELIVG